MPESMLFFQVQKDFFANMKVLTTTRAHAVLKVVAIANACCHTIFMRMIADTGFAKKIRKTNNQANWIEIRDSDKKQ